MTGVLAALGWGPFFEAQLAPGEREALRPGRAVADRGRRLLVRFEDGDALVTIPGRFRARGEEPPVVGDFVLAGRGEEPPVARVLRRRSRLSRGVAGRRSDEQVIVANVDLVFVVQGVDGGVKPRRIERTLAAVRASGAEPVVLITKMDLLDDPADREVVLDEARAAAGAAPLLAVSADTGEGVEDVRAWLAPGRTGVFVGPSGAGKSTLVNALLGAEVQETEAVRPRDARGRHRTTGRELFVVAGGGAVIDGPGVRELKLWDPEGIEAAYDDVAELATRCRFRDCRHAGEPGCAVRAAVDAGVLGAERVAGLRKLEGEARAAAGRHGGQGALEAKQRARALSRTIRRYFAEDRGGGRGGGDDD